MNEHQRYVTAVVAPDEISGGCWVARCFSCWADDDWTTALRRRLMSCIARLIGASNIGTAAKPSAWLMPPIHVHMSIATNSCALRFCVARQNCHAIYSVPPLRNLSCIHSLWTPIWRKFSSPLHQSHTAEPYTRMPKTEAVFFDSSVLKSPQMICRLLGNGRKIN